MLRNVIENFPKQFAFKPVIRNEKNLVKKQKFTICGMGGSNLAAELIKAIDPSTDMIIHRNYSLPSIPLHDRLNIFSSYSGETEEIIDGFKEAVKRGLPAAVIAAGGELLKLARENSVPYIKIPKIQIQPRHAIGFSFRAHAKLMGHEAILKETSQLSKLLKSKNFEKSGRVLSEKLKGKVPVIYTSERFSGLGYNWKVRFNETAKIPAFCNFFPELNHNEMVGFEADHFHFIFLKDEKDHRQILKRMGLTEKMLTEQGFQVDVLNLCGRCQCQKIFSSIILADWTTMFLAEFYGHEPESSKALKNFKKFLK